jgi:hypothetical protein
MARTSLQNILSLPDAAQAWNFSLFFPTIPGSSLSNLAYRCISTTLPASKIEPVSIELAGVKKQEAGRAQYDHTFQATFLETVDYASFMAFRAWRDYTRSWKNNTGTNASQYKINLELDLYDNAANISQTIIMAGAWITDIADVTLSGAESTAVNMQATFSFDYIDDGRNY